MGRKGRVAHTCPDLGHRYARLTAKLSGSLTLWDCLRFPQPCLIPLSTPPPHPTVPTPLPSPIPLMHPTITLHISSPWTPSQISHMKSAHTVVPAMGIASFCCACFVLFFTWHDPWTSSKSLNRTLLPHTLHFVVNHYLWGLLL